MRYFPFALALVLPIAACAGAQHGGDLTADLSSPEDLVALDLAPPADMRVVRPPLVSVSPADVQVNVGVSFMVKIALGGAWYGQDPLLVQLSSSDGVTLMFPATAAFRFNDASVTVTVAATRTGTATLSAMLDGVTKMANVTVLPSVKSLSPSPLRIETGKTAQLTVTLSDPALPGGHDVVLASGDPKVAAVMQVVNVPEGKTSAQFDVVTLSQGGPVVVTAALRASKQAAEVRSITPVGKLAISEVLYDALGPDDGYEWVELWNGTTQDIDLAGYFLGTTYSSNVPSYVAATPALTGVLKAGDCKVVGGKMADPNANTLPVDFMFLDAVQFNPVLPNGTMTTAEGVALFKGAPPAMNKFADPTTIVDAVIYGTAQRSIADETGNPGTLDIEYVKFPKQTLERLGPLSWRVQPVANAGQCDWLHL